MSPRSADYRSERPTFVSRVLCSRDFTLILKTTRRLSDLSSFPTTSIGSALPLPVAETKSRKHLWFAEELDSGLLSSTSRLSCTTEIERAWLNLRLAFSFPSELVWPSTTMEPIPGLISGEQAAATNFGDELLHKFLTGLRNIRFSLLEFKQSLGDND